MRPLKLFGIILLLVCSLSLSAESGSCFTTDNVTVTRSTDKDVAVPGTSVTVTVDVTNLEPDSLRGFYYAEEIPQGLAINTVSVKMNGNPISDYILESGSVGDVYPGDIPYRWVMETPATFSENNSIPSGANVEIVYTVSSDQPGTFHLDEFHWVGYYEGGVGSAFGYSEGADKKTIYVAGGQRPRHQQRRRHGTH
jgi:hypothetical protein